MKDLTLELSCETDMKAREWIEKSIQTNKETNPNEAYYNAGADEMLDIVACFLLSQFENEQACIEIRQAILNRDFEDNTKDYLQASQSANMLIQEFFKSGVKKGFKLAIESFRNTLEIPAINDDEDVD
jgi:flagellar biosynthesis/type III secretory pathway protein FliH